MEWDNLLKHVPHARWRVVSPGRVNLLGEHVDYNQGLVLPAAIDRYVKVVAAARPDQQVILRALDMQEEVRFSLDNLTERVDLSGQPLPGWALYPAGVAWALSNAGYKPVGMEAAYSADVPIGAGLSSSAAVEVAFAVLWQAIGAWELDRMSLAKLCQQAENHYVGVGCGLMDQFACAHGVARYALSFDVRSLVWQPFPLPPDTTLVIADSGIRRQLSDSAYNQRRAECEEAVRHLREWIPAIDSLRDVSLQDLDKFGNNLPATILKRAAHVVEEIERVRLACLDLVRDDAAGFGGHMIAGHASLRDLFEVSTPQLDALVEMALDLPGCLGARLTGAGFGGCTVNLVDNRHVQDFCTSLAIQYASRFGIQASIYRCTPARGAFCEQIQANMDKG